MSKSATMFENEKISFVGEYQLVAAIGRGKLSEVYRAHKKDDEKRSYALKILANHRKNPQRAISMLQKEAIAMLSCVDPHVIRLFDYVIGDEKSYLVMEYAECGDLATLLHRQGKAFTPAEALDYIRQLLMAVDAVHKAGIIHRDIKPENILLTSDKKVKLSDFGIASLAGEQLPEEEAYRGVGTFDYLAPESLEQGINNQQTDVYAVGVTLYQLLTSEMPFAGVSFKEQVASKMRGERLPLQHYMSHVPRYLDELISVATSPDPHIRFKSAQEFRDAIEDLSLGLWEPPAIIAQKKESVQPTRVQQIEDTMRQYVETVHFDNEKRLEILAAVKGKQDEKEVSKITEAFDSYVSVTSVEDDTKQEEVVAPEGDDAMSSFEALAKKHGASDALFRDEPRDESYPHENHKEIIQDISFRKLARTLVGAFVVIGAVLIAPQVFSFLDDPWNSIKSISSEQSDSKRQAKMVNRGSHSIDDGLGVLSEEPLEGVIDGLLVEGHAVQLVSQPGVEKNSVVLKLSLNGADKHTVGVETAKNDKSIEIVGNGLRVTLFIDQQSREGSIISGEFRDYIFDRTGRWSLG